MSLGTQNIYVFEVNDDKTFWNSPPNPALLENNDLHLEQAGKALKKKSTSTVPYVIESVLLLIPSNSNKKD